MLIPQEHKVLTLAGWRQPQLLTFNDVLIGLKDNKIIPMRLVNTETVHRKAVEINHTYTRFEPRLTEFITSVARQERGKVKVIPIHEMVETLRQEIEYLQHNNYEPMRSRKLKQITKYISETVDTTTDSKAVIQTFVTALHSKDTEFKDLRNMLNVMNTLYAKSVAQYIPPTPPDISKYGLKLHTIHRKNEGSFSNYVYPGDKQVKLPPPEDTEEAIGKILEEASKHSLISAGDYVYVQGSYGYYQQIVSKNSFSVSREFKNIYGWDMILNFRAYKNTPVTGDILKDCNSPNLTAKDQANCRVSTHYSYYVSNASALISTVYNFLASADYKQVMEIVTYKAKKNLFRENTTYRTKAFKGLTHSIGILIHITNYDERLLGLRDLLSAYQTHCDIDSLDNYISTEDTAPSKKSMAQFLYYYKTEDLQTMSNDPSTKRIDPSLNFVKYARSDIRKFLRLPVTLREPCLFNYTMSLFEGMFKQGDTFKVIATPEYIETLRLLAWLTNKVQLRVGALEQRLYTHSEHYKLKNTIHTFDNKILIYNIRETQAQSVIELTVEGDEECLILDDGKVIYQYNANFAQ